MKNKNILMMLLAAVMISSSFFAGCKKDDDDDNNNNVTDNCRVVKQTITSNGNYFNYSYDNEKRLVSIVRNDNSGTKTTTITYNNSTVESNYNNGETVIVTVNNSKGLPQQISVTGNDFSNSYNASYSSDDKLLSVQGTYRTFNTSFPDSGTITLSDIVYSNGNITSAKKTQTSYNGSIWITNFSADYYTDKENSLKHINTGINTFEIGGENANIKVFSKNLIKSYQIIGNSVDWSGNYTYTFDNDGKVNSISFSFSANGGFLTYDEESSLEYVCD